ncbi:MAG TPA: hypothetical protein PKW80_15530 [Bacteroidales bacterium]|nr:hypothetical protein [Bacteroidales bacterium]
MIRIIKKTGDTPSVLKTKGQEEIEKLKKMTDKERLAYRFSPGIYGCKAVKNKLKTIQNDKCCFCESKVSAVSHGDVEHYRPKGGWIQNDGDKLTQPGYYWLAYDFSNLFLSCQLCNEIYKKNYFPLSNPNKRALVHTQKISDENPMIIDPGTMDPSEHIEFRQEIAHGKTKTGEETIKRTGLNRTELADQRLEYLKVLTTIAKLAGQNTDEGKQARKQLEELVSDKYIYSLMVQDTFGKK